MIVKRKPYQEWFKPYIEFKIRTLNLGKKLDVLMYLYFLLTPRHVEKHTDRPASNEPIKWCREKLSLKTNKRNLYKRAPHFFWTFNLLSIYNNYLMNKYSENVLLIYAFLIICFLSDSLQLLWISGKSCCGPPLWALIIFFL